VVLAETNWLPGIAQPAQIHRSKLGRQPTFRFGPRSIDIDILFYDDWCRKPRTWTILTPAARAGFCAGALAEIAPSFIHPVLKKRIIDLVGESSRTGIKFYAQTNGIMD